MLKHMSWQQDSLSKTKKNTNSVGVEFIKGGASQLRKRVISVNYIY